MNSCSASEVAEKRRLALEKLAAKKQRLTQSDSHCTSMIQQQCVAGRHTNPTNNCNNKKSLASASNFLNDLKERTANFHRSEYYKNKYGSGAGKSTSAGDLPAANAQNTLPTCICKVYLVSPSRFEIQQSSFHAKLIDVFKTIPTRSYDSKTRNWSFGLQDYETLQNAVRGLKSEVVMGTIPFQVIKLCRKPANEADHSCLASIEPTLADKLMPFQKEGVCAAIAQQGRFMICDEMGLGKTYQALAVADFYREWWPLLICTAASVRNSWATHIRELLPHIPVHYIQTVTSTHDYVGDAKVIIVSYSLTEKCEAQLVASKFGCVIFDESHMLKNHKSLCATVAGRFARQARHVIMLSGTPALSRPLELFSQLQMIDKKFMTYMEFTNRYCDAKQTRFGWDASGQSNLQELQVVLKLKFMIRRTKEEVLPQLADKLRETVLLDPALIWTNDETKADLEKFNKRFSLTKGKIREEVLMKFYTRTAEVKTRAVCNYLKNIVKQGKKFIVFGHHYVMLNAITECLQKLDVNFIRIDGSTKNEARAEYINIFQTKPECKVAVLSLKSCNAGITLTAAELIIFTELDWNPSTLAQAESRAHRIGQEKPVVCRYLMASQTADDIIWNMLKSKQDVLNRAGLFSDNLQDARHSAAQMSSYSIEKYLSPIKKDSGPCETNRDEQASPIKHNNSTATTSRNGVDEAMGMELENVEEFFQDNDDEQAAPIKHNNLTATTSRNGVDEAVGMELENIEEFFQDNGDDEQAAPIKHNNSTATTSRNGVNEAMGMELENIEEFFQDNDDDEQAAPIKHNNLTATTSRNSVDEAVGMELENIEEFFQDNDDDAFKDLIF